MNRIVAALALACAIFPAAHAEKVRVDFDHARHFSHYKTFSWAQAPDEQSEATLFPNQLMQGRIIAFIEGALAAKGFKHVQSGGDLLISYQIGITEEPIYTTINNDFGWGAGWGPGWGNGISTTTVQTIYRGTLIVDMRDGRQNQLVFQGASTQTLSSRPPRNTKKMAKAVNEIFEKYPPQL